MANPMSSPQEVDVRRLPNMPSAPPTASTTRTATPARRTRRVPLVLLQHFRGNLDNWDPALVDALAANRRVITFDNAGVGRLDGIDAKHHRSRWPTTRSRSSTRSTSAQVDLLGSPSAASSPRRSR